MRRCRWRIPVVPAALALSLVACDRSRDAAPDPREQWERRAASPESELRVWYYGRRPEHWPYVRVEVGKGPGSRVISGAPVPPHSVGVHSETVPVPRSGILFVRVSLVTPQRDTLARTAWDSLPLAPGHRYQVSVYIADRPLPREGCMGDCRPFTAYPIRRHAGFAAESLFVLLGGLPKGAVTTAPAGPGFPAPPT
jgi:hypothetical protein